MEPVHAVQTPAVGDATPLPIQVDALAVAVQPPPPTEPSAGAAVPFVPTVVSVLRAITAAGGPWFPARFAAEAGVPRDSLDEPLAELRVAGLVQVAEWVRGIGQGYALTPDGETAATDATVFDRLKQAAGAPTAAPRANAGGADTGAEEPRDPELALNPPIVVPVLLMANAAWFFVCAVKSIMWGLTPARALSESHPAVLHTFGAVSGVDLVNGEWWRLVTSCFVHIGALHLIGNMFALAMMGPLAELLWGRGRLLLIYFVSGLAGSALAMALRPDSTLAGASGAIWGIQMSLFAWLFAFRRHLPPDLASDWLRRLSVVFALNAGVSFLPGISWEGHLGGGVAGLLAAGLLNAARFGDRPRRVGACVLLALLPVVCVAGVVAAMDAQGMPGWLHLRQRLASEREARELSEWNQNVRAAQTEFNRDVAPRLPELAPEAVRPVEQEALDVLALKTPAPDAGAAVRAKVEALKGAADAIVGFTARDPTGADAFDRHRDRVRALAAARGRSFDLLLGLLDANLPPTAEARGEWRAARRAADRLWAALTAK